MGVEARLHECEIVRLEQLPEVDVRQRPRVRGIACTFEAVEVERLQRVDRCDLVGGEEWEGSIDSGYQRNVTLCFH